MELKEYLQNNIIYLDGGMGTLLQEKGLASGELPERWNISYPDIITDIHTAYFNVGSNIVFTNTFGANTLKFSKEELEQIISAAVENAKRAKYISTSSQPKWIALDIGPTGRMLAPYGDLDFEEAVSIFSETVRLGVQNGVDLICIETMNDSYETKAALLAAKENSNLPIFVTNSYGEDGKLMTGASPAAMIAMLEGMGADAIGINCSFGPRTLQPIIEEYLQYSSIPVILKPNAGMPQVIYNKTIFDLSVADFGKEMCQFANDGVRIMGGCCGTTPEYIKELVNTTKSISPVNITNKNISWVSSYTHAVIFDKKPILIGERINPTGKKRFKEALKNNDLDYILQEGISQQEKNVDILDVNVGIPEIDEVTMLKNTVCGLQAIIDLPLQIDTSNVEAMEIALRHYNGKAMINSVNGKQEVMDAIFPLAKKYGGFIVALTLDENGIPDKAEDRIIIAKKILKEAAKYGINKNDIIFDPLALTISADTNAGNETLKAISTIRNTLHCHTSLGVSNVSFGLPNREVINSTFLTLAMGYGLSAAIINPYSLDILKAHFAYCALKGIDANCSDYISFAQNELTKSMQESSIINNRATQNITTKDNTSKQSNKQNDITTSELQYCIIKGLKERAHGVTSNLLQTTKPLDIIQEEIIPALDIVGDGFENKTIYLPQLLMSAETAKIAFDAIKTAISKSTAAFDSKDNSNSNPHYFVIATVKGDVHDIGKNIVKLLLENYGFNTIDLGKNVAPETIVEKTIELHAPLVGLSALMTTTVPAMEETIKLLRKEAPWCKIVVGGAVLTKEYADTIGADKYAKDAMETVRYAKHICSLDR